MILSNADFEIKARECFERIGIRFDTHKDFLFFVATENSVEVTTKFGFIETAYKGRVIFKHNPLDGKLYPVSDVEYFEYV